MRIGDERARKACKNSPKHFVPGVPPLLTVPILREEAIAFAKVESKLPEPSLYGVTDGKAVGTYLDTNFKRIYKAIIHSGEEVRQGELISRNWMLT